MLAREIKQNIVKDLKIPYQEENTKVAFSNPSDAARTFIKANNWAGTIVEALVQLLEARAELHTDLRLLRTTLSKAERLVLAGISAIPTAATKNKDVYADWIYTKAEEGHKKFIEEVTEKIHKLEGQLDSMVIEETQLNLLLKHIDRACENATQFINWAKYEGRENGARR